MQKYIKAAIPTIVIVLLTLVVINKVDALKRLVYG